MQRKYKVRIYKSNYSTGGVIEYPDNLGKTNIPNVEVEHDETVKLPTGELYAIKGKKHSEGGEDVYLEPSSLVYSDHLKVPKEVASTILGTKVTKKLSYADLSKKFDTTKWSKILDNPNSDKYAKETAKLKLSNNNSMLDIIFQAQELSKGKGLQGKFQDKQVAQMGLEVGDPIMRLKKTYPERSDTLPEILITGKRTVKDYTAFDQAFNRGSNDVVSSQTESVNEKVQQYSPSNQKIIDFGNWEANPNYITTGQMFRPQDRPTGAFFDLSPKEVPNVVPTATTVLPLVEPDRSKPQVTPVQPIPTRGGGTGSSKKSSTPKQRPNFFSLKDEEAPVLDNSLPPIDLTTEQRLKAVEFSPYVDNPDDLTTDNTTTTTDAKKKSAFGIGSKLAGTILDIGLAASDKLRVVNPQYRDLRKQPLFSRFVDFDDKEAGRNMALNIQQIQNSNMPEEVKQSRIADLNAQYKDYTAKIDFANAQRYEQKIGQDTEKLQNYINANIDQHYQDIEMYNQKKARVDELVDAFKAQKKSRIVNSLKQYANYVDEVNYKNQILGENYKVNPFTGKVEFTGNTPDALKKQEQELNQYAQNSAPVRTLPGGLYSTFSKSGKEIIIQPNGTAVVVDK